LHLDSCYCGLTYHQPQQLHPPPQHQPQRSESVSLLTLLLGDDFLPGTDTCGLRS